MKRPRRRRITFRQFVGFEPFASFAGWYVPAARRRSKTTVSPKKSNKPTGPIKPIPPRKPQPTKKPR